MMTLDMMSNEQIISTNFKRSRNSTVKTIVFWNPNAHILEKGLPSLLKVGSCHGYRCRWTINRRDMEYSDAVIFDVQTLRLLPRKEPGQVWVFFTMESPNNCHYIMNNWKNVFNWTLTYRRDSDIPSLYKGFKPRTEKQKQSKFSDILPRKSKETVWMVSNCYTSSGREQYVAKLQTLTNVDIFGRCGWLRCPCFGKEMDCMRRLLNDTYKFYLSFENSLCRDYATEKLFKIATYDIIPVVRGGYNISLFAPYNSYIDANVMDPSALYAFLKRLSNDNINYAKYFEWRKHYIPEHPSPQGFCDVCNKLHGGSEHNRLYRDIEKWWWGDDGQGLNMCNYRETIDRDQEVKRLLDRLGTI